MENIKVTQLNGGKFILTMKENPFNKSDVLFLNGITCKVVKVRKFTWWRKLLFRLGFKYHSMDLKQIK